MATQSILKNITITEPTAAEIFINAMEQAAEAAENSDVSNLYYAESKDLSKEELKKFSVKIK